MAFFSATYVGIIVAIHVYVPCLYILSAIAVIPLFLCTIIHQERMKGKSIELVATVI